MNSQTEKQLSEKSSETQTLDQRRAKHAWNVVQNVKKKYVTQKNGKDELEKKGKEFGIQVKKMPVRIMAAGLGQALAFLQAKDYAQELQHALSDWIHDRRFREEKAKSLLERLMYGDANFQRYATAECLAYLVWLVRFSDAEGLTKSLQEG